MFLACLPLLQPNGFCVCMADGGVETHPKIEESGSVDHSETPRAKKVGCCSRCCDSEEPSLTGSNERDSFPSRPPQNDHHLPGCPASPAVDKFKWSEPAPSVAQLLPSIYIGLFVWVEAPAETNPLKLPFSIPFPTIPPSLTHCPLLI